MRTNIDIDDSLMDRAIKVSGLGTKKATVEAALRLLIRMDEQAQVRRMFGRIPLKVDLNRTRQGRNLDRR